MNKPTPLFLDLLQFFLAIGVLLLLLLMPLFLLGGCATTPTTPPATRVVSTVTSEPPQKIPVLMPCLTADQIPKPPASWMSTAQSWEKKQLAAAADFLELDAYIVQSQNRMWDCVKSFKEETK